MDRVSKGHEVIWVREGGGQNDQIKPRKRKEDNNLIDIQESPSLATKSSLATGKDGFYRVTDEDKTTDRE